MRTLLLAALLASTSGAKPPDAPFAPKPATEPKPDTAFALKDLRLGKPLAGDALTADDLKGKVVVVEFWGVNCPRCLAALPETAALHADLVPFGLVVVGAHTHKAPPEYVKAVARARGANFPLTEQTAIAGHDVPELPHAVVFDHTGACIFRGTPRDAEVKARRAVGEALVANARRDTFGPQLTGAVAELKRGQSPHLVLPKVLKQLDGPAAEDAKALLKSLTAVGQRAYDRANERAAADPVGAFRLAESLPAAYKGTPLAAAAAALVARLKTDTAVAVELAARPTLATVRQLGTRLALELGTGKPADAEFQKANAELLGQLREAVARMRKDWPTARVTAEAEAIAGRFAP